MFNKIVTLNEKPNQYEGIVINFNPYKGFAFFKPNDESENIFIPPHLVELNSLVDGLKISVEKEDYIDNRTEETKIRVTKVNII